MSPTIPGTTAASDATDAAARFAWAAIGALLLGLLAYAAIATPGSWFSAQEPIAFGARQLALVRGTGALDGDALAVTASGPDGSVLISIDTDLRSDQYRGIAWTATDISAGADVRLLWRTDVAPARVNSIRLPVESGRPLSVIVANNPAWIGRIRGLALYIGGPLDKPVSVRGVAAKPMGVRDVLGDRLREWMAYEPWSGQSVNEVAGGADVQELPLPLVTAAFVALSVALWALWTRLARRSFAWLPYAVVAAFMVGWAVLDARFTWNLARQAADTAARYGNLDARGKHLAAEDGNLFAFMERVRAALPGSPARVFVAAEAPYFRGRAAYQLYPHNVFYDPTRDALPSRSALRPGDWLVVYERRGIQYDAAARRLQWDGGPPVPATRVLAGDAAALFRIEVSSPNP